MNWYCVQTKPLREKQVVKELNSRLGLEVYYPRLRTLRTIRRVRCSVTEALFPRYLFCRFNASSDYRAVRYTHDIIDIVSFGTEPTIVSDELIQDLKAWAGDEFFLEVDKAFASGDRVQITAGPMQGLQAVILEARSDSERVAVLLSLLGGEARLTLDRSHLVKAL